MIFEGTILEIGQDKRPDRHYATNYVLVAGNRHDGFVGKAVFYVEGNHRTTMLDSLKVDDFVRVEFDFTAKKNFKTGLYFQILSLDKITKI